MIGLRGPQNLEGPGCGTTPQQPASSFVTPRLGVPAAEAATRIVNLNGG